MAVVPAALAAVFVFWGWLMSHVMNTYARLPVTFSHGEGSRITDTEGKEYLDALSGIAVSTLGHAHPEAGRGDRRAGRAPAAYLQPLPHPRAGAACRQAGRHCPAWTRSSSATPAARPTRRRSSWRASTATRRASTRRPSSSWKRLSTAAPWRRCRPPATARCRPASSRWSPVSCACRTTISTAIEAVAEHNKNVVAVLVELVQGEGGIHIADVDFLQGSAPALRRAGLAADLRRGAVRHRPHRQVVRLSSMPASSPDVMTLAKGLGSRRADRRLPGRAARRPGCSSRATTARPSAAIRWPARRR